MIRLNKYIAQSGIASRRKADDAIRSGQVSVNGQVIHTLGTQIDPARDTVAVNGKTIKADRAAVYIALHKPPGYVCTHARHRGEKSIFSLLPKKYSQLRIAGRLDKQSEGLVLLSNDGDFIYDMTHPSRDKEKEYLVETQKPLSRDAVRRLRQGVRLTEGIAAADRLEYVRQRQYQLVIHQGWNRQIRRMMDAVGAHVGLLIRVRIGQHRLESLKPGQWKEITALPE